MKKAVLEKIMPERGSSFRVLHFEDGAQNENPFWHFHPEIELVFVNGGTGKRHIGRHLSCFRNGDLLMIGSNLPHSGFTNRLTKNKSETVIQIHPEFFEHSILVLPELAEVKILLEKAKSGIAFKGETKRVAGQKIEKLAKLDPFPRFIKLLEILSFLANSSEYELLNSEEVVLELKQQDNDRISIIYKYVKENFREPIRIEDIAREVNMTGPSFCRYFKKIVGKTFTSFVNEVRVTHATKLLSDNHSSITEICYDSGFNNFSHFNKVFKKIMGRNPSDFRDRIQKVISGDQ